MYGFGPDLNTENIYQRITSLDIFERYCENFEGIGKPFKGVLRSGDSKPSAKIDIIGDDLLYKDFGQIGSYRAIPFVAKKFGTTYYGALQIINKDFQLGLGEGRSSVKPIQKEAQKFKEICRSKKVSPTEILVKRRKLKDEDLKFWSKYYWTKEMLRSVDICPISHFWVNNPSKGKFYQSRVYNLAYTLDYYWHGGVFRRKIYQPHNKFGGKFISNVDFSIVQGYKRLDKTGDILFITSSLKDCGPFWRLGYNAIAPNSETTFLPEVFINKYRSRYKRIIIWFDNDQEGIESAKKFSQIYQLEYFYNPIGYPKDPSDFCLQEGLGNFYNYINKLIY